MLKLIKKLFQPEPPIKPIELKEEEIESWLNKQAAELNFQHYFKEYIKQITKIKSELLEKAESLSKQEISETHQKQVEERIKNIVVGHKEHYVKEIMRFSEKILPLSIDFTTIDGYSEALQFNEKLDEELSLLAKRTAKSYQAAQHLFFDTVESMFKLLGKLNTLVKNFSGKVKENKIGQLKELNRLAVSLNENINKRKSLEQEIKNKRENLIQAEKNNKEKENRLKALIESKDYQEYLNLKKEEGHLNQQHKDLEYNIFSFFSKLNKTLKKYEHLALGSASNNALGNTLGNKLIKAYLEDSSQAFWQDSELKIIAVLEELRKKLLNSSLQVDEKQKNNVLELIDKSEKGYLLGLQKQGKQLQKEKETLNQAIKENKVSQETKDTKNEINCIHLEIESIGKKIADLNLKLDKKELEKNKQELIEAVKEILNKEIIIASISF